jgi:methyl-accepting chemotaxis protein
VFVDGVPVGTVAVLLGRPPIGMVVREMAPTMALVGGSILVVGSILIALFVFGPARRRLKQLQEATVRFGSGDMTARAPDRGGDEVAALARSFNQMGDELASRAHALDLSDKARRQLLADVSARADDTTDRDARLHRNADDEGAPSRSGDARPLSLHHR